MAVVVSKQNTVSNMPAAQLGKIFHSEIKKWPDGKAITLVLHHPTAAAMVKAEALEGVDKPGVTVLRDLLAQAAGASSPSTAMLLERWRDLPEYDRLAELAMAEPLVAEPEAAAKELQMAVEKLLEEYGPGRRMDELLRKAEEMGLNYDEKAELSSLLKSKGRS